MAGTPGSHAPFMASITVTGAAATLRSYLQAIWSDIPQKCSYLQLQLATGAGAATVSYGNSNLVSVTQCGGTLSAGQISQTFAFDSNLMSLDDFYVIASAGSVQVNCVVVVR